MLADGAVEPRVDEGVGAIGFGRLEATGNLVLSSRAALEDLLEQAQGQTVVGK